MANGKKLDLLRKPHQGTERTLLRRWGLGRLLRGLERGALRAGRGPHTGRPQ